MPCAVGAGPQLMVQSPAAGRAHLASTVREGGCRILLAEDDDDISESVSGVLEDAGYVVEVCHNGQEALNSLREHPADLIVLDLMMPVMDGWEFRAIQRADRAIADIPVVVISADGSAKAAAVHAESYVKKPFGANELISAVERVLLERERRNLAARLEETERLALLGTIAAGVGHEINNPLSFTLGNLELSDTIMTSLRTEIARLRQPATEENTTDAVATIADKLEKLSSLLEDCRTGAERVRLIVRNLQSLSRRSDDRRVRLDVRRVIDSAVSMVWHQIKTRAKLDRRYQDDVAVAGDETRLGQVFLNLLVNAAQSIHGTSPDHNMIQVVVRKENGLAVVEIRDSGIGMSQALRARIFEPFFTTKGQGEGTGLGLSICRDIVEAHGGEISVESEPGFGSTFTVKLPLWADGGIARVSEGPRAVSSHRRLRTAPSLLSNVWIVDDDPLVAHAMSRMLGDTYQVLVTKGPRDVLERIENGESFDALLCDIMMPEMNGMTLCERIAALNPDLARHIVFISGGMIAREGNEASLDPKRLYLQKPFEEIDLRRIIERATEA